MFGIKNIDNIGEEKIVYIGVWMCVCRSSEWTTLRSILSCLGFMTRALWRWDCFVGAMSKLLMRVRHCPRTISMPQVAIVDRSASSVRCGTTAACWYSLGFGVVLASMPSPPNMGQPSSLKLLRSSVLTCAITLLPILPINSVSVIIYS